MKNKSSEQALVDLVFEMVLAATADKVFCKKTNEEKAKWVADKLRACGFDTSPRGMSWGVLTRSFVDLEGDNTHPVATVTYQQVPAMTMRADIKYDPTRTEVLSVDPAERVGTLLARIQGEFRDVQSIVLTNATNWRKDK